MTNRMMNRKVSNRLTSGKEDISHHNANKFVGVPINHEQLNGTSKILLYNQLSQKLDWVPVPSPLTLPKVSSTYFRTPIEASNVTTWTQIDPNFTVSITPQKTSSDILIHCNLYGGTGADVNPSYAYPYAGFKLYRRIQGESTFSELTNANGIAIEDSQNPSIFMVDSLGSNNGSLSSPYNDRNVTSHNTTGTFKDIAPLSADGVIKEVTYTLYWLAPVDGSGQYYMFLNRPKVDAKGRPRMASSMTLTEIIQ